MDNVPMKKCKHCQTDIPAASKVCPNCKRKQKKPMGCLIAIIAVVVIGIVGASAGSKGSGDSSSETSSSQSDVKINKGDANTSETDASSGDSKGSNDSASDTSSDSGSSDTSNVVEAGDSFEASGLKISFTKCDLDFKVKDDKYDLYKPADGKKFIALSFKFENTGDKDEYVSIYDFDCYADNETCDQKFFSKEGDFINTNLSKGRNVSFTIYYEVPEKAKNIELEYEADFWTDEKVIIKAK